MLSNLHVSPEKNFHNIDLFQLKVLSNQLKFVNREGMPLKVILFWFTIA